ncbi:MAG: hypothetical protein KGL44_13145, partial [Sphingomonadales bacterium]|nr:hypothetical protein [Sphingomonadales bacterium]
LSSAITQGVGVATGLQDKFDWAGVAAAGVAAGVGVIAGKAIGAEKMFDHQETIGGKVTDVAANLKFDNIVRNGLTGVARAIASAATRSVIEGSDFGDNILGALPGEIGGTIGEALGNWGKRELHEANEARRAERAKQIQDATSKEQNTQVTDIDSPFGGSLSNPFAPFGSGFIAGEVIPGTGIPTAFVNDGVYRTIDGVPVDQFGNPVGSGNSLQLVSSPIGMPNSVRSGGTVVNGGWSTEGVETFYRNCASTGDAYCASDGLAFGSLNPSWDVSFSRNNLMSTITERHSRLVLVNSPVLTDDGIRISEPHFINVCDQSCKVASIAEYRAIRTDLASTYANWKISNGGRQGSAAVIYDVHVKVWHDFNLPLTSLFAGLGATRASGIAALKARGY